MWQVRCSAAWYPAAPDGDCLDMQEGLELNPGFGISDVGLDVVMREHYSGAIPNWNAPHWTQPIPFEGKK